MTLVAPVSASITPGAAPVMPVTAQNKAKRYGQRDTDEHLFGVVAHSGEKICKKFHVSLSLMNKVQL